MSHRSSERFLCPRSIMLLFFTAVKVLSVKITVQPSSHSGPRATSDDLVKLGRMCPLRACGDRLLCWGRSLVPVMLRLVPSGCVTSGPV